MEKIHLIIGMSVVIVMAVWPLVAVVYKKRTISRPYDKSIIYLAVEMSYAPERWGAVKVKVNYEEPKSIGVPFIAIWRGMVSHPFSSLGRIGSIWYGLAFLSVLMMLALSNTELKSYASDFMIFSSIFIIGLCWFVYYFRSVSADLTESSLRSDVALTHLIDLKWDNVEKDLIETVKDEVKVDFELFKKESGIAGLLLIVAGSSFLIYSRVGDVLSPWSIGVTFFLFGSIFVSKWLYEGYRARVIYISLNTVLALIKAVQIKNANKSIKE